MIIDAGMLTTSCSWNHNGSLIAISGRHTDQDRQCNVVQFYNPFGDVFSLCMDVYYYFFDELLLTFPAFTHLEGSRTFNVLLRLGRRIITGRFSRRLFCIFC